MIPWRLIIVALILISLRWALGCMLRLAIEEPEFLTFPVLIEWPSRG